MVAPDVLCAEGIGPSRPDLSTFFTQGAMKADHSGTSTNRSPVARPLTMRPDSVRTRTA